MPPADNNMHHITTFRHDHLPSSNHATPVRAAPPQPQQPQLRTKSVTVTIPTSRSASSLVMPTSNGVAYTSNGVAVATRPTRNNGTQTKHATGAAISFSKTPQKLGTLQRNAATNTTPAAPEFGDYLAVATHQLALAAQREAEGEYSVAYDLYSLAVDILLRGVQTDTDQRRRDAVRRKTAKYLKKAESLYSSHVLTSNHNLDTAFAAASTATKINAAISSNVTDADVIGSNLPPQSSANLKGSEKDLQRYKVVRSVAEGVLLVVSPPPSSPSAQRSSAVAAGETFCMKVLRKCAVAEASSSKASPFRTIVPTTLPFMVPLIQFIETPDAIYLITAWAKGGKLFDYVQNCCNNPYETQQTFSDAADDFLDLSSSMSRRPVADSKASTIQSSIMAFVRRYGSNKADDDAAEIVTHSTTVDYKIPSPIRNTDAVLPSAAHSSSKDAEVVSITVGRMQSVVDRLSDDDDDDDEDLATLPDDNAQISNVSLSSASEAASVFSAGTSRAILMTRSTSENFDNGSRSRNRPELLTTTSMLLDDKRLSPINNRRRTNEKSGYVEHAHITVQHHALHNGSDLRHKDSNNKFQEKIIISDAVHYQPTIKSNNTNSNFVSKEECRIRNFMHADHFSGEARAEECQAMNTNAAAVVGGAGELGSISSFSLHDVDDEKFVGNAQHQKPDYPTALKESKSSSGKELERLEISTIKKTVRRASIQSKSTETHERLIDGEAEPTVTNNDDSIEGFTGFLMDHSTDRNDKDDLLSAQQKSVAEQQTNSLADFFPVSTPVDISEFDVNSWETSAVSINTTSEFAGKRHSSNYDLLTQELTFDNNVVNCDAHNQTAGGRRSSQSVDDAGHDSGWWPSTSSIEYQQQYESVVKPFSGASTAAAAVLNRSAPSLQQALIFDDDAGMEEAVMMSTQSRLTFSRQSSGRARHVSADVVVVGKMTTAGFQPQNQRDSMTSTSSSNNSAADILDASKLVTRARALLSRVDERLKTDEIVLAVENKVSDLVAVNLGDEVSEAKIITPALPIMSSIVGGSKQRKTISDKIICNWLAELAIAVDALHQIGISIGDLSPDNVLFGPGGHVHLTYISQWRTAPRKVGRIALQRLYAAPELRHHEAEVRPACDAWSIGAIAFELFTRTPLYLHCNNGAVEVMDRNSSSVNGPPYSCLPAAVLDGSSAVLSELVSAEARDLLIRLLKFNPEERLSLSGMREHSFFRTIDWSNLETVGMSLSSI